MGVQQKLMRHAQIATTMNVYGDTMMESKRTANSKVVERYFGVSSLFRQVD
jgi:integrase